jgi:hypothetical protein
MALKRINKELTDLGRYVDPLLFTATRFLGGAAAQAGSHARDHQQLHIRDQRDI